MNDAKVIVVSLMIPSLESLHDAFETNCVKAGDCKVEIDAGTSATVDSVIKGAGLEATEILVNVAISFFTGVPASLIATWIYLKFASRDDVISIQLNGKKLERDSIARIELQVRKELELLEPR